METVEVVIKVPKDIYEALKADIYPIPAPSRVAVVFKTLLQKGTVLPKRHGRIIDESRINKCEQAGLIMKNGDIVRCLVTDAPTIIEKVRDKK
jgi:hypothetical protein